MPEYDAFGREIGEDTLAGWRAGQGAAPAPIPQEPSEPEPAPEPEPAAAAPVFTAEAATPDPPRPAPDPVPPVLASTTTPRAARPRGRRPRVVSRLIILIVVVVIGANVVGRAVTGVQDAVDGLPSVVSPAPVPETTPPVGLQAGSMIRPGELRRALARLRGRGIGRVQTLRLAPERIDAALLTRRTTLVNVQLRHAGEFQRLSESGPGFGHLDTIPYARLDPAAPQRLVRAAAARLHRPTTRIDYLVPSIAGGDVTWGAYFKGGAIFIGDAHGRITRRIS